MIKTHRLAPILKLSLIIIAKVAIEINTPKITKIIPKFNEKYENIIEIISQDRKSVV
mgnify:FL=1